MCAQRRLLLQHQPCRHLPPPRAPLRPPVNQRHQPCGAAGQRGWGRQDDGGSLLLRRLSKRTRADAGTALLKRVTHQLYLSPRNGLSYDCSRDPRVACRSGLRAARPLLQGEWAKREWNLRVLRQENEEAAASEAGSPPSPLVHSARTTGEMEPVAQRKRTRRVRRPPASAQRGGPSLSRRPRPIIEQQSAPRAPEVCAQRRLLLQHQPCRLLPPPRAPLRPPGNQGHQPRGAAGQRGRACQDEGRSLLLRRQSKSTRADAGIAMLKRVTLQQNLSPCNGLSYDAAVILGSRAVVAFGLHVPYCRVERRSGRGTCTCFHARRKMRQTRPRPRLSPKNRIGEAQQKRTRSPGRRISPAPHRRTLNLRKRRKAAQRRASSPALRCSPQTQHSMNLRRHPRQERRTPLAQQTDKKKGTQRAQAQRRRSPRPSTRANSDSWATALEPKAEKEKEKELTAAGVPILELQLGGLSGSTSQLQEALAEGREEGWRDAQGGERRLVTRAAR